MKIKTKSITFLTWFMALMLSAVVSSGAAAKVFVVIDDTFEVTTHGAQIKELGNNWHQLVTFHKVVKVKNRAYACVGYLGNVPRKEFLQKARIVSGNTEVKTQLGGATWLVNEPKVISERKRSNVSLLGAVAAPADISLVTGSKVKCLKGVKWQDNFTSDPSRLEIPDKVWVEQ
ncbi:MULTISPECIES: hypothetical protein [unclassified Ruegeria]|uniref:hypothetical protein n=1 Tax=unclassified Ruegeria TaxID=2625375 RepID=UPI001488A22E|nr:MULTISPECIES: hypothetical protein [unclassified Ruegeria]